MVSPQLFLRCWRNAGGMNYQNCRDTVTHLNDMQIADVVNTFQPERFSSKTMPKALKCFMTERRKTYSTSIPASLGNYLGIVMT